MAKTTRKKIAWGKNLLIATIVGVLVVIAFFLFLLYQTQKMSLNLTQQLVSERLKSQVTQDVIKYFGENEVAYSNNPADVQTLNLTDAERDDLINQLVALLKEDVTDDVYRGVEELTAEQIEAKVFEIIANSASFAAYSEEQRELFAKEISNIIMKDIGGTMSDMYTQISELNNLYVQLTGISRNGDTINNSVTNLAEAISNNNRLIAEKEASLQAQINEVRGLATNNTYASDISSLNTRVADLLKALDNEKDKSSSEAQALRKALESAQKELNSNITDTNAALEAINTAQQAISSAERYLGVVQSNVSIIESTIDTMIEKTETYTWTADGKTLEINIPVESGANKKTLHDPWE